MGRLADKPPSEGRPLAGLLVRHGYADSLMHPADLPLFTKLRPGRILQRQAVACPAPFSEVPPYPALCLCMQVQPALGPVFSHHYTGDSTHEQAASQRHRVVAAELCPCGDSTRREGANTKAPCGTC